MFKFHESYAKQKFQNVLSFKANDTFENVGLATNITVLMKTCPTSFLDY